MEIEQINIKSKRDRKSFIDLIYKLALHNDNWIPGLRIIDDDLINPDKNPFLKNNNATFFMVKQNDQPLGRCALFESGYLPNEPNTAHFGFVDFVDNSKVTESLFNQLFKLAKQKGINKLVGPFNPNINYSVGVLKSGFELSNKILMNYNPPYYLKHFLNNEFEELKSFKAWEILKESLLYHDRFQIALEKINKNKKLLIRNGNLNKFKDELIIYHQLYIKCFENHWGFVAPSWEEFKFIAADLKWIIQPELAIIAEYNKVPVGFVLCVPNYYELLINNKSGNLLPINWLKMLWNKNKIQSARVMIAGVLPEYRRLGVHLALFQKIASNIETLKFKNAEISWVLSGNSPLEKSIKMMGAKSVKEYLLLHKTL